MVVVTSKDADNARLLKDLHTDEVVWLQDLERDLPRAVRGAESRGVLQRVASEIERSQLSPPLLRSALAQACRSGQPVQSVHALAAIAGRDRRTLARLWRVSLSGTGFRLKDFLDWLLIVRALSRKHHRVSWAAIATELGVHEHTLARAVHRLLGVRLGELGNCGELAVAERFARAVLAPMLRNPALLEGQARP
jgi:hypothetical protein